MLDTLKGTREYEKGDIRLVSMKKSLPFLARGSRKRPWGKDLGELPRPYLLGESQQRNSEKSLITYLGSHQRRLSERKEILTCLE